MWKTIKTVEKTIQQFELRPTICIATKTIRAFVNIIEEFEFVSDWQDWPGDYLQELKRWKELLQAEINAATER